MPLERIHPQGYDALISAEKFLVSSGPEGREEGQVSPLKEVVARVVFGTAEEPVPWSPLQAASPRELGIWIVADGKETDGVPNFGFLLFCSIW